MNVLNQQGLVKRFMDSSGYTNLTCESGIMKNHKRRVDFDYRNPDRMLKDFLKWMKDGAGKPKVRDLDYKQIGSWVAGYRLPYFQTAGFTSHYNSVLEPAHALIIWQLRGCVSSPPLSKAFKIDVKTVRDIWLGKSWVELTESYEASL